MAHLKRYSMPGSWPLQKKERVYVGSPLPGPHGKNDCITVGIILRDMLKHTESIRETKKLVKQAKIFVDKKPRKEQNFPVGLMDVVEIPEVGEFFRMNINKNGLFLEKIKQDETNRKICKITKKTTVSGGKCQLNLHDGRCIIVENPKTYKVGDSLTINLPDQKILKHLKLEKNASALVINGRNVGTTGKIKEIKERKFMQEKASVTLDIKGKIIETLKDYVMVIGD